MLPLPETPNAVEEEIFRRVVHRELEKRGHLNRAESYIHCSDVDTFGTRHACRMKRICPWCARAYADDVAAQICPALRDPDIDDDVLLDQSGSPDYRAVSFKRLTLVTDLENSWIYHQRAMATFDCARDVTQRLLRLPGSGALLAIQPRDVIEVRGIIRGSVTMDLPNAWRLRTRDSDAAYAVELVTAQDVRRHVLDVLSTRMDVDPIDLVASWVSGPPMRTRRYGSFRHGCRRGSVFDPLTPTTARCLQS
jgi:hypothetical protein